jgi:hypothetical protein
MGTLRLASTPRYICYTLSILFTAALLLAVTAAPSAIYVLAVPLAVFAGLTILGTRDLVQTRHSVLRSYPISAHLRFLLETMRPEMRQYFFEGEKDGAPFSRDKRALVYQRAKMCSTSVRSEPITTSMATGSNGCGIRCSRGPMPSSRSGSPSAGPTAPGHTMPRCSTSRP